MKIKATTFAMIVFKDVNRLEHDPGAQYRFNRFWAIFWALQMPLVILLDLQFPHFWILISVMYFTQASLWANFATHFGAMSSALAADKAKAVVDDISEDVDDLGEDIDHIHAAILPDAVQG